MYTVDWSAVDPDLVNYWLAASSPLRRAITEACNRLDRNLSRYPGSGVVSADPDYYVLDDPPVRVFFRIDVSDQKIIITSITILKGSN